MIYLPFASPVVLLFYFHTIHFILLRALSPEVRHRSLSHFSIWYIDQCNNCPIHYRSTHISFELVNGQLSHCTVGACTLLMMTSTLRSCRRKTTQNNRYPSIQSRLTFIYTSHKAVFERLGWNLLSDCQGVLYILIIEEKSALLHGHFLDQNFRLLLLGLQIHLLKKSNLWEHMYAPSQSVLEREKH